MKTSAEIIGGADPPSPHLVSTTGWQDIWELKIERRCPTKLENLSIFWWKCD